MTRSRRSAGITALALAAATFSHAQGGPGGASQPTSDFAEEAILASAEKAFAKDPSTQVIRYFDPSCGGRTRPRSRGLTTYRQWREAVARSASPKCPYAEVFGWEKVRLVRIFRDGQRVVKVINAPSEVESLLQQVVFATTSASGAARRRCQLFVRHGMPSVQWATEAYLALRRQFQDCELALFVRRDDCFGSELAFPVINLFAELHSCPPSDAVSGEYIACHGDVPGSPGCTIAFDEPQIGRQGLRNRGD